MKTYGICFGNDLDVSFSNRRKAEDFLAATNKFLNTVVIVPMTSTIKPYPTRLNCQFKGKDGQLVVDQIRCVDKTRLTEKLGTMDANTCNNVCTLLVETFKYQ